MSKHRKNDWRKVGYPEGISPPQPPKPRPRPWPEKEVLGEVVNLLTGERKVFRSYAEIV